MYGVVYRKLVDIWWANLLWSIVMLKAMREGFVAIGTFLYNQYHPDAFVIIEAFIFLTQAALLSILRGSSGGDWFNLVALSGSDILSIVKSTVQLWYEKTHNNNDLNIVHLTLYILLEEMTEMIVPIVYFVSATILYFLPAGKNLVGIKMTGFGVPAIEDIRVFQDSLLAVFAAEVSTFGMVYYLLIYILKIPIIGAFVHYMNHYGNMLILSIIGSFMILYCVSCVSFGADTSFQLEWYT